MGSIDDAYNLLHQETKPRGHTRKPNRGRSSLRPRASCLRLFQHWAYATVGETAGKTQQNRERSSTRPRALGFAQPLVKPLVKLVHIISGIVKQPVPTGSKVVRRYLTPCAQWMKLCAHHLGYCQATGPNRVRGGPSLPDTLCSMDGTLCTSSWVLSSNRSQPGPRWSVIARRPVLNGFCLHLARCLGKPKPCHCKGTPTMSAKRAGDAKCCL